MTLAPELLQGLPLAAPSPSGWVAAAVTDLPALLVDHAHCELKAAANAMAIAGRHADRTDLVRDLTALAREELRHFEQAHAQVRARGGTLTRPAPDLYVRELQRLVRRGRMAGGAASAAASGEANTTLLDELIVCGFIEARSCERFRLLAASPLVPTDLRAFYGELAAAEARHHELFFGHARAVAGATAVADRISATAQAEAELVARLPLGARIH
jgi:tRNA 2-(methylsulfanyl)-N6-isopentenyladenosine37 hydroxylase